MLRTAYLATLVALQFALLVRVSPRVGIALHADAALGALPSGFPAMAQFAGAAMALIGGSIALVFPGVALLRHYQRGAIRFCGLPRWAVHVALAGGAIFAIGLALEALSALLPAASRHSGLVAARPAQNAGIALAAAGTLCAELLRRSIGPLRGISGLRAQPREGIAATDPSELRTRAS